ncbi:hypothetical protein KOW79_013205 [Hemibagrus wyckioides]|uniref:Uncharacterized protein n=1 Tax=Hemibagrus wyckioides TaxID=337641 RepID=A0A9D3NLM1_9TELE|nr:hypothetical protein KOW79_013205 [Hemibagrus wyckioides]
MKRTTEQLKRQLMDGGKDGEPKPNELKSGQKLKRPIASHIKTSTSGMGKSGEMEGATEKNSKREQKKKVRKLKRSEKEKGRDVSGAGGASGEEKARKRREDENIVEMKESPIIKKSRGEKDSKQNLFLSVSYSPSVDLIGGDKNIKQGKHRQVRDEVYKSSLVQTHTETDRKKSQEERDQRDEASYGHQYASFSSCSAPEETSNVPEEEMFFYRLVPGSLVWARQSGCPW